MWYFVQSYIKSANFWIRNSPFFVGTWFTMASYTRHHVHRIDFFLLGYGMWGEIAQIRAFHLFPQAKLLILQVPNNFSSSVSCINSTSFDMDTWLWFTFFFKRLFFHNTFLYLFFISTSSWARLLSENSAHKRSTFSPFLARDLFLWAISWYCLLFPVDLCTNPIISGIYWFMTIYNTIQLMTNLINPLVLCSYSMFYL